MRSLTCKHPLFSTCALLLVLGSGCGDDSKDEAGGETAGTAETGGTGSSAETGTASMTGDGDGDPGDGDGAPGDGDGDGAPGDGDGTPGDGDGAPGDGDGDPGNCVALEDQASCDAEPGCQSVVGQPLKENGPDAPCLEPSEFLGCIPSMGCGDALTWFCVGGNGKATLVPDTCGPDGAEMCDPGLGTDVPACP